MSCDLREHREIWRDDETLSRDVTFLAVSAACGDLQQEHAPFLQSRAEGHRRAHALRSRRMPSCAGITWMPSPKDRIFRRDVEMSLKNHMPKCVTTMHRVKRLKNSTKSGIPLCPTGSPV